MTYCTGNAGPMRAGTWPVLAATGRTTRLPFTAPPTLLTAHEPLSPEFATPASGPACHSPTSGLGVAPAPPRPSAPSPSTPRRLRPPPPPGVAHAAWPSPSCFSPRRMSRPPHEAVTAPSILPVSCRLRHSRATNRRRLGSARRRRSSKQSRKTPAFPSTGSEALAPASAPSGRPPCQFLLLPPVRAQRETAVLRCFGSSVLPILLPLHKMSF